MTPQEILDLPMQKNDANAATIRDYLKALLLTLWKEDEGFSGKRPFGNSGWTWDLLVPLGHAGLIKIDFDEGGFIEDITRDEERKGESLIVEAIRGL